MCEQKAGTRRHWSNKHRNPRNCCFMIKPTKTSKRTNVPEKNLQNENLFFSKSQRIWTRVSEYLSIWVSDSKGVTRISYFFLQSFPYSLLISLFAYYLHRCASVYRGLVVGKKKKTPKTTWNPKEQNRRCRKIPIKGCRPAGTLIECDTHVKKE